MPASADLHVHSKYSDRPSEWILRRIGSPESFTEPLEVYRKCIERGMKFVTISDHNRIDGALAIAHLPNTFISSELTTYFPDEGAKVHFLVTGVTEAQFAICNELRTNIYDLRRYIIDEDICHSVAHPLFRPNDRLSPDHIEKLMVLFNRFEQINGTRDGRASEMVKAIFGGISPELIDKLADKHGIEPVGPAPWNKTFTGGSDDHGGVYIASAYTTTPDCETVEKYLDFIRNGNHEPGGGSGNSIMLAHSFYHIAYSYYKRRLLNNDSAQSSLIATLFSRLLEASAPKPTSITDRAKGYVRSVITRRKVRKMSPVEQDLVAEFTELFANVKHGTDDGHAPTDMTDQHTFDLACNITHRLSYSFFKNFLANMTSGNMLQSLQTIASLGPVAMSISPYLASMATQHKDEKFMQDVARRFDVSRPMEYRSGKWAWLTDTFNETNGVAMTIKQMASAAKLRDADLTVVTSLPVEPNAAYPVRNFEPIGRFNVPEYEELKLAVPPFLEMLAWLEDQRFSQLVISTPGPVGLTGLLAGRLMGLRMIGIYHTDLPRYVQLLTEDNALAQGTARAMVWFYSQMDLVLAPSRAYRKELMDMGIDPARIQVIGRGIDTERFSPAKREEGFFKQYGMNEGFTYLYVGRVSQEKNVHVLAEAFEHVHQQNPTAQLAIIGGGPQLEDLKKSHRLPFIHFLGEITGHELTRAYASADAFVFPSTTDTFGNVILEAKASGLPCIVTNQGGPSELVEDRMTGLIINLDQRGALVHAMKKIAADKVEHTRMRRAARAAVLDRDWLAVFDEFKTMCEPPTAGPTMWSTGHALPRRTVSS